MELLSLMLLAKRSEFGIEIQTNDSERFQARFHAERTKQRKKGISFDELACRIITPTQLFLYKKGVKNESNPSD